MHPLFDLSSKGLGQTARRATMLNLGASAVDFVLQFLTLIVLARLLTPADFGLMAMVTPFIWFIMNFGDLGLGSAIVQQTQLTPGQASAIFRINLVAGFTCGMVFLAASPLLGWFYQDPRVVPLAATLSLVFLISGLLAVQRALLRRALQFAVLFRARIAASLLSSAVAVGLALAETGYWALAARMLLEPFVYTVVIWISSSWLPARPEWDSTTKKLLRLGSYSIGGALVTAFARQGDNLVIGWRYGSAELGPYALGCRLLYFPIQQFTWPVGAVMVPALSRLTNEPDRLKTWYTDLLRLITLLTYPALFTLALCANDLVYVVLGPQWHEAIPLIRLLAPVSALLVGFATVEWLMYSQGRIDRAFRWATFSSFVTVAGIVAGLPWGAFGVAAGLAAANFILFIPALAYGTKGTPIALIDVLKGMVPSLIVTAITVTIVFVLGMVIQEWSAFWRLLASITTIATSTLIGMAILSGQDVIRFLSLLRYQKS